MSQSFAGVQVFPYVGTPYNLPLGWGQRIPNRQDPSVTVITIPWNIYWAAGGNPQTVGVGINIQAQSVFGAIIDKIESVKIDNTGNISPVTVIFPDTGDAVTCPANSIIVAPALTNSNLATIYAQGLEAGYIGATQITFCNRLLPSAYDPNQVENLPQHIGSPVVQRNYTQILTPGYGPPALGDQADTHLFDWNATGQRATLFGTPRSDFKFIYLTNIFVNGIAMQSVAPGSATQVIQSTGAAGILFSFSVAFGNAFSPDFTLLNLQGCNLKLDASQSWEVNQTALAGGNGGFVGYNFAFSVNN